LHCEASGRYKCKKEALILYENLSETFSHWFPYEDLTVFSLVNHKLLQNLPTRITNSQIIRRQSHAAVPAYVSCRIEGGWPQSPWESWKPRVQGTNCLWLKLHPVGLHFKPQQYLRCQGSHPDKCPFRQPPAYCSGVLGISQRDIATGVGEQRFLIFLFTLISVFFLQGLYVFPP